MGSDPFVISPPPQVVKEFIHNTRRYQGAAARPEVGSKARK